MTDYFIRDIPSLKKLQENAKAISLLKKAPFILRLLGLRPEALDKFDVNEVEALVTLPDQFNSIFAARGWITYEMLNVQVAQAAISKAKSGDLDGAESILVEYYDAQTVKWNLQMMAAVKAFRPRAALASKALTDYNEGRYHACVPVVLSLLDGLVNDVSLDNRSFFSGSPDLDAWDSISAHSKGLGELVRVMHVSRQKTRTDPITIPYRNGILHGMDLGYDNKIVAAKSWAALFAVRDWAVKVERGKKDPQPEKPQPGWREILQQLEQNTQIRRKLDEWKPREISPGTDIPISGEPEVFASDSPEQKLAEFMLYWKHRNYGKMTNCLPFHSRLPTNRVAGELRANFAQKTLISFAIVEVKDEAPAITAMRVHLCFESDGRAVEKDQDFRIIYEDSEGNPLVRDMAGGQWCIYTYFVD